jgi:hypothetical protein
MLAPRRYSAEIKRYDAPVMKHCQKDNEINVGPMLIMLAAFVNVSPGL